MKASSLHLAALAVAVIFSACEKEETKYSRAYGEEIVFGAQTSGDADTKATYSGDTTIVNKNTYERIDWQTGDKVRIVCPQASEPTTQYLTNYTSDLYEDYTITTVTAGKKTEAYKSSAGLKRASSGEFGLRWGSASTHYFYSLYPCPSNIDGVGLADNGTDIVATCVIPATQTYSALTVNDGNYTATPNPDYLYLVGYATASTSGSDAVQIDYNPAFTAFEITVTNDYETANAVMTVASVSLSTAAENASLAATYDVAIDGTVSKTKVSKHTGGSDTVTMSFDPALSIANGKSLTFTLFAQPEDDITKLTFKMTDSESKVRSIDLKYRKATDNDWVTFTAFHKSKITGLMAPETSSWYINLGGGSNVTLEKWTTNAAKEVTEITLAENSLDVYCTESDGTYAYYSDAACANALPGNTEAILINGSFTDNTKPSTSSAPEGELGKLVTASIVQTNQTGVYNLSLAFNPSPSSTPAFTDNKITGTIYVNQVSTNSYAEVAVTIHKVEK